MLFYVLLILWKNRALLNATISINCHNQTPFLSHLIRPHSLAHFFLASPLFCCLFKAQQFTNFSFSSSTWLFSLFSSQRHFLSTFIYLLSFPIKMLLLFLLLRSLSSLLLLSISLWASFFPYRTPFLLFLIWFFYFILFYFFLVLFLDEKKSFVLLWKIFFC